MAKKRSWYIAEFTVTCWFKYALLLSNLNHPKKIYVRANLCEKKVSQISEIFVKDFANFKNLLIFSVANSQVYSEILNVQTNSKKVPSLFKDI